jgi:hypothetical protein
VDCRKNKSKVETLLHLIAKLVHGEESGQGEMQRQGQSGTETSLATTETFYSDWVSVWDAKNVSLLSFLPFTIPPLSRYLSNNWNPSSKISRAVSRKPRKVTQSLLLL